MTIRSRLLSAFFVIAGACGGMGKSPPADSGACEGCLPPATAEWVASMGAQPLDLLVVVDDRVPSGPAGVAYQASMRALAANMESHLEQSLYAADIHIAMVPASLAPGSASVPSRLWPESDACVQPTGAFLHASVLCDAPGNFAAPLGDALACAGAHLPASGQPSLPLEVVRMLLSPGGPAEATGFRRAGASLFLAIVTSEDDPAWSAEGTRSQYDAFFSELFPTDGNWEVAVVAPAYADGLRSFAKRFSLNGMADDVTADSWTSLSWLGEPAEALRAEFCIQLTDPAAGVLTAGAQPDCRVVQYEVGTVASEVSLPPCPIDGAPTQTCWRAVVDHLHCPDTSHRILISTPAGSCRSSQGHRYQAMCFMPPSQLPSD